ncbi:methyltransferase [Vibrio phage phi 2]|uniref:DNA methyltransferase n=1 Tax=Vibrio phage X29 TaxID=1500713 RepID=UPI00045FE773|nr:DNA methyltransferase [Vibrio phage X29]AHN84849.1 methyltransferase [Vibrio phage phi 2]AIA10309.1 methyltransferase [Vibrio phage X29]
MKKVLDACCGSKMFWFDENNPLTIYQDKRELNTNLCDVRQLIVKPDVIGDFTNMDWSDGRFKVVVLDPPHFSVGGDNGWQVLKYGRLPKDWQEYIAAMFKECFRVLEDDGVLVFKWNETQIKVSEILALSEFKPMLGNKRAGKSADTHWILFMKNNLMKQSMESKPL